MTDTTTADKLAAWELIEQYNLIIRPTNQPPNGYRVYGDGETCTSGPTRIAAVRAWAEAAGVPWPSVNVVPMWCVVGESETTVATASQQAAASVLGILGGRVVPCEVVIVETKGV